MSIGKSHQLAFKSLNLMFYVVFSRGSLFSKYLCVFVKHCKCLACLIEKLFHRRQVCAAQSSGSSNISFCVQCNISFLFKLLNMMTGKALQINECAELAFCILTTLCITCINMVAKIK